MIGVFDSGVGGLTALCELRKIAPNVNICFLADRKNAPYGTKKKEEIVKFTRSNIKRLRNMGVDKILMACCTASTVYQELSIEEKRLCVPIIEPAARRALTISKNKRIGVIATERTVKEEAFKRAILKSEPSAYVFELQAQKFVSLVESGARDFILTSDEIKEIESILLPIKSRDIDTLILGCTHFPHIKHKIEEILGIPTVNPSLEGALEIAKHTELSEDGRTIYL